MIFEVCLDTLEAATAAQDHGATRLELCADLHSGGTTPSLGLIEAICGKCAIPVHVMIRPRGGDFVHDERERRIMARDIEHAAAAGARGVVFGLLTRAGQVDAPAVAELLAVAHGHHLQVTFHRAFDVCPDPLAALATLADLGVDHLLSSGQAESAWAGRDLLRQLVQTAGRVKIIAGAGVQPGNARALAACGVSALHFTARTPRAGSDPRFGQAWSFDAAKLRGVVQACAGVG